MFPRPPSSPLFPYTTLFRSLLPASSVAVTVIVLVPNPTSIPAAGDWTRVIPRSEEHTSELQSRFDLVCRLLLEKKKNVDLKDSVVVIVNPPCQVRLVVIMGL